eukprot:2862019-Pyramimonas_sp.AAC.1
MNLPNLPNLPKLPRREGDPGGGGQQGTRPRAGQLGGPASRGVSEFTRPSEGQVVGEVGSTTQTGLSSLRPSCYTQLERSNWTREHTDVIVISLGTLAMLWRTRSQWWEVRTSERNPLPPASLLAKLNCLNNAFDPPRLGSGDGVAPPADRQHDKLAEGKNSCNILR